MSKRVAKSLIVRRHEATGAADETACAVALALANGVEHLPLEGRIRLDAADEDCRRVTGHLTNQPTKHKDGVLRWYKTVLNHLSPPKRWTKSV